MAHDWEHLKELNDPRKIDDFVLKLLGEVENLQKDRNDWRMENLKLREVMKIKEAAAIQRLEAMKSNANAQLLDMEAQKILEAMNRQLFPEGPQEFGYIDYIRPVQPANDRDEDVYSDIVTTAIAKVATDDITSGRSNGSVASLEERIEIELHNEYPRADSSAPRLPPRPRSISQSTIFRIGHIQETQPPQRKDQPAKRGSLKRILRSFRRKKKT